MTELSKTFGQQIFDIALCEIKTQSPLRACVKVIVILSVIVIINTEIDFEWLEYYGEMDNPDAIQFNQKMGLYIFFCVIGVEYTVLQIKVGNSLRISGFAILNCFIIFHCLNQYLA